MPNYPAPVDNRSAWTATELANDSSWQIQLTTEEITNIVAATDKVRASGLVAGHFGKDSFVLSGMQLRLSSIAHELHEGRGVVVLRGLPADAHDEDWLRAAYWGICSQIGTPISQNSKGEKMAAVTDHGNDISRPNTRGYATRAALGSHSDMCQMTALLCVHPARSGGESCVASSMSVYNHIRELQPEHLRPLLRGFHHDLRGEGPTASIDEVTHHRVPVFSETDGWLSCGFNPKISVNGEAKRGTPVDDADIAALDCITETAILAQYEHRMWLERGDIQIVNNHTILHSRSEFIDHDEPGMRRKLMRLWLNPYLTRPLDPHFSDRYNTGPGGGVARGDGAEYQF